MLKNLISQGDFVLWPQLSLVVFLATFIAILAWVCRPKATDHYASMAALALDDPTDTKGEKTHVQG